MSVSDTLAALKTRLLTVNPTPQPAPARVYDRPAEAVSLGDFPAIVLSLAPGAEHAWREEALGLGQHDYVVTAWVFVGPRGTGLAELLDRVLPWPQAIADVLVADLTLAGQVHSIGYKDDNRLFTYKIGPIAWSDGDYFGLSFQLPVIEHRNQTMG